MDNKRIILYFALALVGFLLWNAWQHDYAKNPTSAVASVRAPVNGQSAVPNWEQQKNDGSTVVPAASVEQSSAEPPLSRQRTVTVTTDVLELVIDLTGGNLIKASLLDYPVEQNQLEQPWVLLDDTKENFYVAESGLTGPHGPDTPEGQVTYTAEQMTYTLAPEEKELTVALQYRSANGLAVQKAYHLSRGDYAIRVSYRIHNEGIEPWQGNLFAQLRRTPQETDSGFFALQTFQGASLSTHNTAYEKFSFSELTKKEINTTTQGGWLAMQQRYFVTAWVPDRAEKNHYYSKAYRNRYTLGFIGPMITVAPQATVQTEAQFYVGPEISSELSVLAPHLEKTIDYGWLWIISSAIFWVMRWIHGVVANWGWSIVLVTLLIKVLFYKLSERSYASMAKMRKFAPRIAQLKDRFGEDRQKLSRATMELYKKEGINPLGGCLPMLIQIPFFIALYYVLIESVELRQAPFIFWIHDLSKMDPYYVLPIIMGLSMLLQQKLNPPPPDPMQAKVMMFLPIVFTLLFMTFPSGLVLYWLVNNLLSVAQQWYIMRRFDGQVRTKIISTKNKKN